MAETALSEAVALVLPVVHARGEATESASGMHSSRLVHYCCLLGLSSQVQPPVTHGIPEYTCVSYACMSWLI